MNKLLLRYFLFDWWKRERERGTSICCSSLFIYSLVDSWCALPRDWTLNLQLGMMLYPTELTGQGCTFFYKKVFWLLTVCSYGCSLFFSGVFKAFAFNVVPFHLNMSLCLLWLIHAVLSLSVDLSLISSIKFLAIIFFSIAFLLFSYSD